MQWTNSTSRYGAAPQAFHWLTLICVAAAWPLGWFMDDFPKAAESSVLFVHMTLGECVIVLLVARLFWRLVNPAPPLEPTRWTRLSQTAATASHCTMYVLLLLVPLAGIVVQLTRGHPLPIFGLAEFAPPWPADRAVARSAIRAHEFLANALVILAGLHAAAALLHHYAWRDRTLARMLPAARRIRRD